jgi:hypothetical protein
MSYLENVLLHRAEGSSGLSKVIYGVRREQELKLNKN